MLESEADRLGMLKAVGGEEFDTGQPTRLWAVFDIPAIDREGLIPVKSRRPELSCRDSDVEAHSLVKGSSLVRVSTGVQYLVRELEPDGTGMTVIRLGT